MRCRILHIKKSPLNFLATRAIAWDSEHELQARADVDFVKVVLLSVKVDRGVSFVSVTLVGCELEALSYWLRLWHFIQIISSGQHGNTCPVPQT